MLDNLALPAADATVAERIKYLISLSRKTQAQFSRLLGIDPSSLSKALTQKTPIADSFLNRIVVNVGVSKEWLVSGRGLPFPKGGAAGASAVQATSEVQRLAKGAPVYDIDVTAGPNAMSRAFTQENIVGYLDMPGINPNYPLVRVSGESMMPRISNGAYIAIREINDMSIIFWGSIYLVELEDYRMVKYLRRHDDPSKVILHSENPNFDDIEVNRADIIKLFLVENIINFDNLV